MGTNLIRVIYTMNIRESTGIHCMFTIYEHSAGQNHNIKTAKNSFERVAKFKYFGTLTNQSVMHKDIINTLNYGKVYYQWVQNSFFQYGM
jgi:hypothetical protein